MMKMKLLSYKIKQFSEFFLYTWAWAWAEWRSRNGTPLREAALQHFYIVCIVQCTILYFPVFPVFLLFSTTQFYCRLISLCRGPVLRIWKLFDRIRILFVLIRNEASSSSLVSYVMNSSFPQPPTKL